MSRFAAVPTAALDDVRLEAMHIRVLTSLCSFADKDGWCRVGQDKIADRARTNNARVSSSLSDLCKWGWVNKKRIGKMKANVYQVLMDQELDKSIPMPDEQECFADTANHVNCQDGKSELPTEQITFADTANPLGTPFSNTVSNTVIGAQDAHPTPSEQPKKKSAPRGSARGSRIPDNWAPTPKGYAFASSHDLTTEEINREADRFRNYWLGVPGRKGVKLDWEATWRNWLTGEYGIVTKKRQRAEQSSTNGGRLGAFDRLAERLEGNFAGSDDCGHAERDSKDAGIIDAEYRRIAR